MSTEIVVKPRPQRKPRVRTIQHKVNVRQRDIIAGGSTLAVRRGAAERAEAHFAKEAVKAELRGVIQKEFGHRVKPRAGKRTNRYLETIVDPGSHTGVRLPTKFHTDTGTVQTLVQTEGYMFPTDSNIEPSGDFLWLWRPSIVHPLWMYQPTTLVQGPPTLVLNQQSVRFGLFPITKGALSPTEQDDQLFFQTGVQYALKAPMTWRNCDFVNDPMEFTLPDGTVRYGNPLSGFSAAPSLVLSVTVDGVSVVAGDTFTVYVTDQTGTSASNTVTIATTGQTHFQTTGFAIASLFTTDTSSSGMGLCVGRPGLGISMIYNSIGVNTGTILVNSISAFFYSGAAQKVTQLAMVPYDFPNQQQFLEAWTAYRPISSSVWIQFQGSDLINGGSITGAFYGGGSHPCAIGLWNYNAIAQIADGKFVHDGKIDKGLYQIYFPCSNADTAMRKPVNSEEWLHPYMIQAGNMATPQANTLRIRNITNFEFISTAQLWQYGSGSVSEAEILHAARVLKNAKFSMENPLHFKQIQEWLNKAMGHAKNFGSWLDSNKGWIMPLAGAAASLL